MKRILKICIVLIFIAMSINGCVDDGFLRQQSIKFRVLENKVGDHFIFLWIKKENWSKLIV